LWCRISFFSLKKCGLDLHAKIKLEITNQYLSLHIKNIY
jgi:hypothetical protein